MGQLSLFKVYYLMNFDILNSQETITTVKLMSLLSPLKVLLILHYLHYPLFFYLSVPTPLEKNNWFLGITFIVTQWVVINLLNWD